MLAVVLASPAMAPEPLVQLNVRIPGAVKAAAADRAESKDMKLGKWVENAIRFALAEHGVTVTPSGRTATPPHRRPPARKEPNL